MHLPSHSDEDPFTRFHFQETNKSNGQRFSDLQPKAKIIWHLIRQYLQVIARREVVVGGINADGFEDLRVFFQAVTLKAAFGDPATKLILAGSVKLPKPALVLPGGCAKINPLAGEIGCSSFDFYE
jgi:hypothetical protein